MENHSSKISLKDMVYQQLVEMICRGELTVDTIFTENQMIAYFKVSKSPVREALIQLCHENVLHSIPRCGYQVVTITSQDIRDLTELRLYLELSSLPKVMDHITADDLEELKNQNRIRVAQCDKKTVWTAWNNNYKFHTTLLGIAGNKLVDDSLKQAMSTCRRAYAQLYALKRDIIAPNKPFYHESIVQSLERHDVFSAYNFLKEDILVMEKELLGTDIMR